MKKYLLGLLAMLLMQAAIAQDVIVKINGDEIQAKVMEITLTEVLYRLPGTTDSLQYSVAKKEVFMVVFANGTREVFQENLHTVTDSLQQLASPEDMYLLGQQDARQYYKGTGAMWGSAASVLVVGPFGPLAFGLVKPKARNNPVPDPAALQDPNYVKGYEKQAHKRKAGKAAIGAGIGTAALMSWVLISLAASFK